MLRCLALLLQLPLLLLLLSPVIHCFTMPLPLPTPYLRTSMCVRRPAHRSSAVAALPRSSMPSLPSCPSMPCRRSWDRAVQCRALLCLRSIVMGNINACDWSGGAHRGVLQQDALVYPEHARVLNGRPFPIGDHVELLVIDDRVGLAAVPRSGSPPHEGLRASFERGPKLLEEAGLRTHVGKKQRFSDHAVVLGQEVRNDPPTVEAERARRVNLAALSVDVGGRGVATTRFAQRLNSSWTHALEVRRPLLSLMERVFWFAAEECPPNAVRALSSRARSEYQLLGVLAPAMIARLDLQHADVLLATDASEIGSGAVIAPIDAAQHQRL